MSNEKYVHQFKTMDDLRAIIKEFEGALARPTRNWSHPTLYRKRDAQEGDKLVQGVRKKDWLLSEDEKWVLPHNQILTIKWGSLSHPIGNT